MEENGESANKKAKTCDKDEVFRSFKRDYKLMQTLLGAVECIDKGYSQMNVCFLELDIADPPKKITFSKATCHTKDYSTETVINVGSIFYSGMQVLANYTQRPYRDCLPADESSREALRKLLLFLGTEPQTEVFEGKCRDDEVSWAVILAQHLLYKLSLGSHYILDKNCPGKDKLKKRGDYCCACKNSEKIIGMFGDTSYGCSRGWHGRVDILIDNVPTSVSCGTEEIDIDSEEDDNSSSLSDSSESSVEKTITDKFGVDLNMQLTSQCIVYSFLQLKKEPGLKSDLIPLIGFCRSKVKILFYDCTNDILMKTSQLDLFDGPDKFAPEVIVLLWLTLNYKLFCTGVPEGYDNHKAQFPEFARDMLPHYINDVKTKIREDEEEDEDSQWAARPRNTPKTVLPKNVCVCETDSNTE